ncbi:hypothetical protein AALO_G00272230 [Alosa alosa]|uniref:Otopetrin 1 n=1 Tax=Alosa alosa TaxID=278164 RepID=A0AAV6FMK0_9TELE|nr:proton channel OTOP1 [Alosa alosa]KAG5264109.1 hypothetical protein AALO_G00272230 [Alosa alosa]
MSRSVGYAVGDSRKFRERWDVWHVAPFHAVHVDCNRLRSRPSPNALKVLRVDASLSKDFAPIDLGAMVEHGGLDIMCLNKYCNSSSSSSTSDGDKNLLKKLRVRLTENYPQKNAEVLSAQYGTQLLLIGVALMFALANSGPSVHEEHLLSFLTTLMILQLLWMLWYIVRKDRQRSLVSEKDVHAGTSWIRGGLSLLALLSLIMDAFRIGYFVGYQSCISAVIVVYPIIHAVHTISQVYFLWFHIKDVINRYKTFERFGVIHAVFTNLLLWCNGVMSESEHFMNNHNRRLSSLGFINHSIVEFEPDCNCTTSACTMFSSGVFYLYPFNIEYHIFVSAMLFVMWKNIGRTIDHHTNRKKPTTRTTGLVLGPIFGLVALASTIGILVVYTIHVEKSLSMRESAIVMFYSYSIAMLAFMCVAGATGLLIYRAEGLPMDTTKNPSRQLDAEVLLGSSVGSWLMSWCSIVAVAAAASGSGPSLRWCNLVHSLLAVLEKYVQNLFIVESLYRKRCEEAGEHVEAGANGGGGTSTGGGVAPEIFSVAASMGPLYDGIINRAYDNQYRCCGALESEPVENGQAYGCGRKPSDVSLPVGPRLKDKPSKKRQILKNIAVFLFMCNISLWILPAFGCRPQYDSGLEQETFGFAFWTTVLNFAIPLNLFYRMHCVASLFEVFRKV